MSYSMPCRSTLTTSIRRLRRFVSLLTWIRRKRNCVCSACGRRSGNTTFIAGREASLRYFASCAWTRQTTARINLGRVLLRGDEEYVIVPHVEPNRSRAVHERGDKVTGFRASARL